MVVLILMPTKSFVRLISSDSSALGMLLQLKEKSDALKKVIKLQNCSQLAKDVLAIANFDKLFEIS